MCTNRLSALDPAIKRRAADILIFERPSDKQRHSLLTNALDNVGFTASQISELVAVTGIQKERTYGFTFSDLTQRLLPALALDAYPSKAITPVRAIEVARTIIPTPPFQDTKL